MITGTDRPILAGAMRFVTAGGLTLALALAQEVARPDRDWTMIATLAAGILVGLCGGAYRRMSAQETASSEPTR